MNYRVPIYPFNKFILTIVTLPYELSDLYLINIDI
jgi:hypothetical protein